MNLYSGIYSLDLTFAEFLRLDPFVTVTYPWVIVQSSVIPLLIFMACWYLTRDHAISLLTSALTLTLYDVLIWNSVPSANAVSRVFMLFAILTCLLEKPNTVLWILATLGAIIAYPLTGMYALMVGLLAFVTRHSTRRMTVVAGMLMFTILPAYMTLLPALGHTRMAKALPNIISRILLTSPRNGLELGLIDTGTALVSVLALFGLFFMYRHCTKDRRMFAVLVSVVFVLAQAALSDLMSVPTLRIHTTVLPFFMLMAASCGLKQLKNLSSTKLRARIHLNQRRHTAAIRFHFGGADRKIAGFFFVVLLVIGSVSLFAFMPNRGPNASTDLIRAIDYVVEQNPTHNGLIVGDQLSIDTLVASAQGDWYSVADRRYGEPFFALSFSRPAYSLILNNPQQAQEYASEAAESVRRYLSETYGIEYTPTLAFVIYNPSAANLDLDVALQTKLVLDHVLTPPVVFGTVFVYAVRTSDSAT
jgi:hypothetical protein